MIESNHTCFGHKQLMYQPNIIEIIFFLEKKISLHYALYEAYNDKKTRCVIQLFFHILSRSYN